ncbi:BTB/POZ domain-containing protein 9-like [Adelges cooleyi]|uniref:BTB/POZ domain-containing protein 9-like n=1 Tax=Adelges cooleyi TaxID=133065 RepID=UPI00217F874C|nr:BTB/POZ domain-containing protein 9-like [Adelges cooleyi]
MAQPRSSKASSSKASGNEIDHTDLLISDIGNLYQSGRHYENKELEVELLKFIDDNAVEVLRSYEFMDLSSEVLQEILDRDSFYAHELDIFRAVCRWVNKNQNEVERDTNIKVLSAVRYPIMSAEEQSQARESQLVRSDLISAAMQLRRNTWPQDKPQIRGQLKLNVHILCEYHSCPLPDLNVIHQSQGFSLSNNDFGTNMIKLVTPSFVNFLEISLYNARFTDLHKRYSYYIEVSNDGQDWVRVVDHSNYNCQGVQELWFHPQTVSDSTESDELMSVLTSINEEEVNTKNKNVSFVEILWEYDPRMYFY